METEKLKERIRQVSEETGAYAEIYIEKKRTQQVGEDEARLILTDGVGLRLLQGRSQTYVYGNDVSTCGITKLIDEAKALFVPDKGTMAESPVQNQEIADPNPVIEDPGMIPISQKRNLIRQTKLFFNGKALPLSSVSISYEDTDQKVTVINSCGPVTEDRRVTGRIRVSYTLSDSGVSHAGWTEYVKPSGFEMWRGGEYLETLKKAIETDDLMMKAEPCPKGWMPVVVGPGAGGTFWHETCGHQLEACAIAAGRSDFCGRLGEKVASSKVTLIDDGTVPGCYGSSKFDDEGLPRRKNILIDHGILKEYLCDRYYGSLIGRKPNGAGRRQDYTFAPVSRMSNTYLAAGDDEEEDMIRDLEKGLYVASWGGGSGGSTFSLLCTEGYLIEQGRITRPVAPCMIAGRGLDVIQKVDRVGKHLRFEMGSFCGADSGLVPVTASEPMMRISGMKVG